MQIGELARAAGVKISTLRYYERRELLAPTGRTSGNYREYDTDALRRVRFIRRAQHLGFTLTEVGQFLALPDATQLDQEGVAPMVASKIDEIDQRIRDLDRVKAALHSLVSEGTAQETCPVLAALADH